MQDYHSTAISAYIDLSIFRTTPMKAPIPPRDDCSICLEQPGTNKGKVAILVPCNHMFCWACVEKYISGSGNLTRSCPLDRRHIDGIVYNGERRGDACFRQYKGTNYPNHRIWPLVLDVLLTGEKVSDAQAREYKRLYAGTQKTAFVAGHYSEAEYPVSQDVKMILCPGEHEEDAEERVGKGMKLGMTYAVRGVASLALGGLLVASL